MEQYQDMKYKAIIFDFDGTLTGLNVDYEALKSKLDLEYKKHTGKRSSFTPLLGELARIKKKYGENLFIKLYEIFQNSEIEALNKDWNFNSDLIEFIRNTDKKVAIFTLNCLKTVQTFLEKLKISHKVGLIVSNESVKRYKPDPEGLKIILKKWNLNKDEVLFIGDSENDFIAGKSIGISTMILK